jgi:predicted MFS family arabinose efflux permease
MIRPFQRGSFSHGVTVLSIATGEEETAGDPRGTRQRSMALVTMITRLVATVVDVNPFRTPEARRLATLFGVVYFAQGMWYLPDQTVTVVLKDRGLSAAQVAAFFTFPTLPWLIKPVYGLVSDFVPLFGRRRQSYFLVASGMAAAIGCWLGLMRDHPYWGLAGLMTAMAVGLAFTDVLTDALMVEAGKPRGLTGAFQAVQWACIYTASIAVGLLGGHLAEGRHLHEAFLLSASFPLLSFGMAAIFLREPRATVDRAASLRTGRAIRGALRGRDLWAVAGFLLFWTFSPSFGPALLYYQVDVLGFSQTFIGVLTALGSAAAVIGALAYAPLSQRVPLRTLIALAIGVAVAGTLAYLLYRGRWSALVIDCLFGIIGMMAQLAFLDLAAKACPRHGEATFFALLMSVYNGGVKVSQIAGSYLYDALGFAPLVMISAGVTSLAWLLIPLVSIEEIAERARGASDASVGRASG